MKMFKKLLGVREATENKIVTVESGSEELTKRLREFDNQALQNKVGTLEKVITFLAQKLEVQSEVIRRQSEAIKQMHLTLEEMANVFESVQNTTINKDDEDEDNESRENKKYLN